jgi:hypothetical protein
MSYDWMEETITMPDGRQVQAKVYGRNRRDGFEIIEYEPLSARWAGGDKLSETELDEVIEADGERVLVSDYLLYRTLDYGVLHLHEPDEDDVL